MVEKEIKTLPIEFVPSDMPGRYATNIVIQHTSKEFVISFWEAKPLPILGTTEERRAKFDAAEHVLAHCVARLVVSPGRMKGFVDAMQENWENYQRKFSATEDNDGE